MGEDMECDVHGKYDKYDEYDSQEDDDKYDDEYQEDMDADVCWDAWEEADSTHKVSELDLSPLTRNPSRMIEISVQVKIKHNKRLAQLAAKECRKVRHEQHNAAQNRLLVRGGRHKVAPRLFWKGEQIPYLRGKALVCPV